MKRKRTAYQRAKDAAWRAFSQYIRIRDAMLSTGTVEFSTCYTCGKTFSVKDLQAGHFIAGRTNGILFDERGVHAQCRGCNLYGGGKPVEYRDHMLDDYGQDVIDDLYYQAKQPLKFSVDVLQGLTTEYKRRTEIIERNEDVPREWARPFLDVLKRVVGL